MDHDDRLPSAGTEGRTTHNLRPDENYNTDENYSMRPTVAAAATGAAAGATTIRSGMGTAPPLNEIDINSLPLPENERRPPIAETPTATFAKDGVSWATVARGKPDSRCVDDEACRSGGHESVTAAAAAGSRGRGRAAAGGEGRRHVDQSRRLETFVVISQGSSAAAGSVGGGDGRGGRGCGERGGEGTTHLPASSSASSSSCSSVSEEYVSTSNHSLHIDGACFVLFVPLGHFHG